LPIGDWSQLPLAFGSITLLEIDATGDDQPRQRMAGPASDAGRPALPQPLK
jgi:hypothetical protein